MTDCLAPLRAEIDALDDEIVALLGKRLAVVHRVAAVKAQAGLPAVLPDRIAAVKARAADRGRAVGLDPDFVANLYQMIIDEACRVEEGLLDGKS
ncbi:chorismate mutase [Azospirillum thermophilum]|uniref:chorismate mutase n=1 Tax=Azospirillum thermophilum TaxID=2202148 RepID=A0A2S2CRA9_9PROT|nr:chorismate mutase [Azospirillum thermophilum]AWK87054.1 chorismate mutase [Azospirillum thermophilum]